MSRSVFDWHGGLVYTERRPGPLYRPQWPDDHPLDDAGLSQPSWHNRLPRGPRGLAHDSPFPVPLSWCVLCAQNLPSASHFVGEKASPWGPSSWEAPESPWAQDPCLCMAVSCILAELPVPGLLPSGLGPLLGSWALLLHVRCVLVFPANRIHPDPLNSRGQKGETWG